MSRTDATLAQHCGELIHHNMHWEFHGRTMLVDLWTITKHNAVCLYTRLHNRKSRKALSFAIVK